MPAPIAPRSFRCRCARPVFFANSQCLACGTPLGYDAERRQLMPLVAVQGRSGEADAVTGGLWRRVGARAAPARYRRCSNLDSAAACNWLIEQGDADAGAPPLCRCCRLTRTLPDLAQPDAALWWQRIEQAKRRLVSTLIALRVPVRSRVAEDREQGLVFDLLRDPPGGPPVVTGHADGVITLNVQEADDVWREQRRTELAEPYRTLLGHLRHETGHYYWQRLVAGTRWHEPWRHLFGDERRDYAAALQAHYRDGAPADWGERHVSAYASSHPWEDWAETWAHYLHLQDTLDTARSFGLDGEHVQLHYDRFGPAALGDIDVDAQSLAFLRRINGWMELTGVLNELSRCMGVADFYPYVLSAAAVRKLHLVDRIVTAAAPD